MGKRLTENHRLTLLGMLVSAYPSIPEFELMVDTRLNLIPANLSPGQNLDFRFNELIKRFSTNSDVLLDAVINDPKLGQNLPLLTILRDIRSNLVEDDVGLVVTDPFKTCLIEGTTPFINRAKYRDQLSDLFKKKKRFLVVNGPPQSGKSHSHLLILEVARLLGHKRSYTNMRDEIPSKFYPSDLARRIDADLTLPFTEKMPDPQNMGEQYPRELIDWLVKKFNLDAGQVFWIVLDGFDHPDLHESTRDFVFKLIQAINSRRLPEVRLVLLDYPKLLDSLTNDVKIFVHTEDLQYFDEPEVKSYFELFFEQANIEADSSQVETQAQEIFQELPPNLTIEERLAAIMVRVMERALALLPGN
jgi:hypothetical protein